MRDGRNRIALLSAVLCLLAPVMGCIGLDSGERADRASPSHDAAGEAAARKRITVAARGIPATLNVAPRTGGWPSPAAP
jgi:hypothetical protein